MRVIQSDPRAEGPASTTAIRTLIVDHEPFYRLGLRCELRRHDAIEVVGEAGTGTEALCLVDALHPRIVISPLDRSTVGGLALARALASRPDVSVILIAAKLDD